MKYLWSALCIAMMVCVSAGADIEIKDAFVQIVPHNTKSAAAYMSIQNNTDKDITLLSAQSTIAASTELHQHIHQDGMAKMVQVPHITIKARDKVMLAPGGYHVMFIGLTQPLKEGQEVSFALHFDTNEGIIQLHNIKVIEAKSHHTHH